MVSSLIGMRGPGARAILSQRRKAGFIYLAMVLDVWSRRVVGWAMGEQMTADLVLAALNMAMTQRRPKGVISP